jgi:hypothetical protein
MLSLLLSLLPTVSSPTPVSFQEERAKPTVREELAKAVANAAHKNRRVLLFAEWSPPSSNLPSLLKEDEELRRELLYEYDLVVANPTLDADAVGILREHGLDFCAAALAVLDAQGNVVAKEDVAAFRPDGGDSQASDAKKALAFLSAHRAPPWDAEVRLREALSEAERTNRRVLVHAGAPW